MASNTVFFLSHSPQIKWYSVFAEAFKELFDDCRVVLFVHGESDKKKAACFKQYDEVIDLIQNFSYQEGSTAFTLPISHTLLELEKTLNTSFFWEDMMVDRWVRAKDSSSFSIQYLNTAFENFISAYNRYAPICGFGESTAAIYRFAHRVFDRDKRPYILPVATRYFSRFRIVNNWGLFWEDMNQHYQNYVKHGLPMHLMDQFSSYYQELIQKHKKPLAFEDFSKKKNKGFDEVNWFDIKKHYSVIKNIFLISHSEKEKNIQLSILEKSIYGKAKKYFLHKSNFNFLQNNSIKSIPHECKFCLYFLHYSPEYTIDSQGRFYRNEQHLVANIAASLPAGYYLLVKEHPAMAGLRNPTFFKAIAKSGNVLLLHPNLDSHQLIKQAEMIFTIVGTASLEAMFLGKPAIIFGETAFTETNLISQCRSFWELGDMIRSKLAKKIDEAEVEKHSVALLAAKYETSKPGVLPRSVQLIDSFVADSENKKIVKESFKQELIRIGLLTG